jgi:hypothetical protein
MLALTSSLYFLVSYSDSNTYRRGRRLTTIKGVYFFFPETNGRHLEEVDQIFIQSKNVFDSVPVARHMEKGHSGLALDIEKHEVGIVEREESMR